MAAEGAGGRGVNDANKAPAAPTPDPAPDLSRRPAGGNVPAQDANAVFWRVLARF